jgi:uncharacterized membrane protein
MHRLRPRPAAKETGARSALFLLVGDLEVLILRHVAIAVLALDVVGLIVAVVDFDVALIDRAPDIGKRLGDAGLDLGRRVVGVKAGAPATSSKPSAAMNILIMAVPPKRARF